MFHKTLHSISEIVSNWVHVFVSAVGADIVSFLGNQLPISVFIAHVWYWAYKYDLEKICFWLPKKLKVFQLLDKRKFLTIYGIFQNMKNSFLSNN